MDRVTEFHDAWISHRKIVQELLEKIDNKHTDFKPWEKAFSLGGMAVHLATSADMFVNMVQTGGPVAPAQPEFRSMEDVRAIVDEYTAKTSETLRSVSEDQLSKEIDLDGFYAPGVEWLNKVKDHEIHHKGQLFVYARLVGVKELPFFAQQPPRR